MLKGLPALLPNSGRVSLARQAYCIPLVIPNQSPSVDQETALTGSWARRPPHHNPTAYLNALRDADARLRDAAQCLAIVVTHVLEQVAVVTVAMFPFAAAAGFFAVPATPGFYDSAPECVSTMETTWLGPP